jgi:hypothetical protein
MPTVRIPIDLTWTGASGSPGVNIWHARVDSILDPNPDVDAMADVLNTFYDEIKGMYSNQVAIRFAGEAQGVGDDTGNTYTGTPWTVNGTNGTGFMPPADCVLVQWRASTGGRSGRGRTFIGPCAGSAEESNGTPTEDSRTLIQGAADNLIDASDSFGNGALGIYSRTQDTFRDVVAAAVPNYFAVLRSRRD